MQLIWGGNPLQNNRILVGNNDPSLHGHQMAALAIQTSIASDTKRGNLPPIHKRKGAGDSTAHKEDAGCSRCKNGIRSDVQPKEWIAHPIVWTAEHSTVTKINRLVGANVAGVR